MSKEQPLWQADFMMMLRWIMFIPIGFMLTAALQVVPSLVAGFLKANMPGSIFLMIVSVIIVIPVLIVLGAVWGMGVLMTPRLICGLVAPSKSTATVIYGMLFCLFEGIYLISILAGGTSWIFFACQLTFSGITVGGIVMLFKEIELSHLRSWILRSRTQNLTAPQT